LKNKPRVFYLSSIEAKPTTSGFLIMHRHLVERDDLNVSFYDDADFQRDANEHWSYRLLEWMQKRVNRTRLYGYFLYGEWFLRRFWIPRGLSRAILDFGPDVILTVAHGHLHGTADLVSRKFKIPLVTIFHDWWPTLAYVSDGVREKMNREMFEVHHHSRISLAVCDGMRDFLGGDVSRTRLLYPLPTRNRESTGWNGFSSSDGMRLIYTGNSAGYYGRKLREFIQSLRKQSEVRFSIYTNNCDWDLSAQTESRKEGFLNSFLEADLLFQEYEKSDFLLVIMSEEQSEIARKTSFPCKTVDYLWSGRPVIAWGPEDSSVVRFLREHQCGFVVTDPDVKVLLESCRKWRQDPEEVRRVTARAADVCRTILNPDLIHQKLVDAVKECVDLCH
jgi:hypothetical protein